MAMDMTAYRYAKRADPAVDGDFSAAPAFSKVKVGRKNLFWKHGLRWYTLDFDRVQRVYRQAEAVYGRLCAGGKSYFIQRLVVIQKDGTALTIHIGDDVKKEAEALYACLQECRPELAFGKEEVCSGK